MARPIRIQYPGAFYHIMTRGSDRLNIFNTPQDYQDFLLVFFDTIKRYNWTCYAYCLMPNHYHLLIKTHLVEEERYKYELIRYIALNPLRANISQRVEDYKCKKVF